MFVFAQLLSYNNHPHPSKILVPPGTTVQQEKNEQSTTTTKKWKKMVTKRPKLDDLIIGNTCGFDCKNRTIICPVMPKEHTECEKK